MAETTIFLANCIKRLQAGDLRARDELVNRVSRRLSVLAARMLREFPRLARWEQSDDLFQQAALRLHRSLADVVPPTPADFLRFAALQLRRELKDLARHYFGPHGPGANHHSTRAPNPSHAVPAARATADSSCNPEKLAIWTEFHAAIEELPEAEQAIVDLLWYHDLSQKEAAEIMQVSERQVRRYWQSARLKLRDHLASSDLDW